jgi:hypothetical protein
MIRVAFNLDQFTILDVRQHPTATMAARPGGPGSGAHNLTIFMLHFFCLPMSSLPCHGLRRPALADEGINPLNLRREHWLPSSN